MSWARAWAVFGLISLSLVSLQSYAGSCPSGGEATSLTTLCHKQWEPNPETDRVVLIADNPRPELYSFSLSSRKLVRLSPPLTNPNGIVFQFVLSPDGDTAYFLSTVDTIDVALLSVPTDGSAPAQAVYSPGGSLNLSNDFLEITADGSTLIVESFVPAVPDMKVGIQPDGTIVGNLMPELENPPSPYGLGYEVQFSPSNRYLFLEYWEWDPNFEPLDPHLLVVRDVATGSVVGTGDWLETILPQDSGFIHRTTEDGPKVMTYVSLVPGRPDFPINWGLAGTPTRAAFVTDACESKLVSRLFNGSFAEFRIRDLLTGAETVLVSSTGPFAVSFGMLEMAGDGSRVVYSVAPRDPDTLEYNSSIYSIPAADGTPQLLGTEEGIVAGELSPDGSRVVYHEDSFNTDFWSAPVDGSLPAVDLSAGTPEVRFEDFRISPDGTAVWFRMGDDPLLYRVGIEGGTPLSVSPHEAEGYRFVEDRMLVNFEFTDLELFEPDGSPALRLIEGSSSSDVVSGFDSLAAAPSGLGYLFEDFSSCGLFWFGSGDADSDGESDSCDACPAGTIAADRDGDLTPDVCDLCPDDADTQADLDVDGVGDACDCDPSDPQVRQLAESDALSVDRSGPATATLSWTDVDGAESYAVIRGETGALPSGGTCLTEGLTTPAHDDADLPAPSAAFFYLAVAQSATCPNGSSGEDSEGVQRPRTDCP